MEKRFQNMKPQYREISISREAVNTESRTVELAFSSEAPVDRWFGREILDHTTSSVRLGRLMDGGPVLMDHNPRDQVGVVERVEIGADRVARAVVRFGKSGRADEIFNDIVDGIRQKVSVGYQIHELVLESRDGDTEVYRVTDWEPLEVSIVSIPADNGVGIGRSHDETPISTPKDFRMETNTQTPAPAAPAVDVQAIQNEARSEAIKAEQKRVRELTATGDTFAQFGGVELAREYVAEGKTVDQLTAALLDRAGKQKPVSGDIGMTDKEVRNYSFLRVLNALANPTDRKAQEAAAFELDASRAAAEKSGKASRGIMVPSDVLFKALQRDLTVGTATAGGHTVATDLMAGSFIDLLRKRMVTQRLGARVLNGLVGNIAIPRHTGAATAYWVAESGAPTESQQAFDQVTMAPKTVGAYTDISRKLLIQSSIDVEALVRDDLAKVLGLEIDRVALYGTGSSNQPLGLKNVSGLNTKDFAAAAPTYAEIIGMETEVAADNADIGTLAYLVNARGRGALKTTEKASNTGMFIWEAGNTVNGYRTEVSNQVEGNGSTSEDYWFGNWDDLMIGFWSGLDLMVDPYTNSTSGTVRVVALQDVDTAVRHPESFCRGANTL